MRWALLCALSRVSRAALVNLVAPVHAAIPDASIEVMINCMLVQSSDDWTLTVVSDGPDARVAAVVGKYTSPRIRFLATDRPTFDHGHSPRELGLNASDAAWTVLSGIDNYYVPLFVETLAREIASHRAAGLIHFDFLLDMKGELEAGTEYQRAVDAYARDVTRARRDDDGETLSMRPLLDGRVEEILFRREDDFLAVAADFVARKQLHAGGGCDDAACVASLLEGAMRAHAADADADNSRRQSAVGGGAPRALPPYTGHIDSKIEMGSLDVGAVAVRTDVARHVGFRWRHHAADFAYVQACVQELRRRSLDVHKIAQVLYVHN
ncbi:hypothetical protein M885DRAFT_620638 [Pelagophyceae sp. CCMP2097]|nr:hypothetical protein M885DRAFT_620638 [Pelagophyceae sp. CCMP2097]